MLLELAEYSLSDLIELKKMKNETFSLEEIKQLMNDIINIIKIMHKDFRLAHRDIKP